MITNTSIKNIFIARRHIFTSNNHVLLIIRINNNSCVSKFTTLNTDIGNVRDGFFGNWFNIIEIILINRNIWYRLKCYVIKPILKNRKSNILLSSKGHQFSTTSFEIQIKRFTCIINDSFMPYWKERFWVNTRSCKISGRSIDKMSPIWFNRCIVKSFISI